MASHQSVLLNECIDGLNIAEDGFYIDGTFGRGGHSKAILSRLSSSGRLLAIDKDPAAVQWAKHYFAGDARFCIAHASFAELGSIVLQQQMMGNISGVLLDLGVSSPQLDEPERGFSFLRDGPLDMRMDTQSALSAEDFVNEASVEDMARVFKEYGEERFSLRIAKAIEKAREIKSITRTLEFAEIVKAANPKWEKHKHPATRVFQAIRIHVNGELTDLDSVLQQSLEALNVGGRLVVISFHSLEDRRVKTFMRKESKGKTLPKNIPLLEVDKRIRLKTIGKTVKASKEEIELNPRARSAVLRIGEKLL